MANSQTRKRQKPKKKQVSKDYPNQRILLSNSIRSKNIFDNRNVEQEKKEIIRKEEINKIYKIRKEIPTYQKTFIAGVANNESANKFI